MVLRSTTLISGAFQLNYGSALHIVIIIHSCNWIENGMAEGVQLFKLIFAFSTILCQFTHDPIVPNVHNLWHTYISCVRVCILGEQSGQRSLVIVTHLSFKITVHLYSDYNYCRRKKSLFVCTVQEYILHIT